MGQPSRRDWRPLEDVATLKVPYVSVDLGHEPERMVRLLVISSLLAFRQLDFLSWEFLVTDLTQQVGYYIQPRRFLSSDRTTNQGAQDVSVAANISSRARE